VIYTDIDTIERARVAADISINHLCKLAGLNQTTYMRLKNGKTKSPYTDTFKKLSVVLSAAEKLKKRL